MLPQVRAEPRPPSKRDITSSRWRKARTGHAIKGPYGKALYRRGIQPGRLNRYATIRGGMLRVLAISHSSLGSPARIDASLLLRTFESHSGSTTTARPTATRSAPMLDRKSVV